MATKGTKGGGAGDLHERVVLDIETGSFKVDSLQSLDRLLASIETRISRVNQALGRASARTRTDFLGALKGGATKPSLKPDDLAAQFGFDPVAFRGAIEKTLNEARRGKKRVQDILRGGEFRSPGLAATALSRFERSNPGSLAQVLSRTGGGKVKGTVTAAELSGEVKITGPIPINLTPANFAVTVTGKIPVGVAGSAVGGGGAGGGGGGGGGGRRGAGGLGPADPSGLPGAPLSTTITRTKSGTRTAYARMLDADRRVTSVLNEKNELLREITRLDEDASKQLIQNLRNARKLARATGGGRAATAAAEARAIEGFLGSDLGRLSPAAQARYGGDLQASAALLRTSADEARMAAARKRGIEAKRRADARLDRIETERVTAEEMTGFLRKVRQKAEQDYEKRRLKQFKAEAKATPGFYSAQQAAYDLVSGRVDGRTAPPDLPGRARTRAPGFADAFSTGVRNQLGGVIGTTGAGGLIGGFIGDVAKVTAWTTAVSALYGTVRLLGAGFTELVEIGYQVARLDQVFSGVGGSAQALAADTLKLNALLGQERGAALESAIAWSRLGLTRQQVNEAVRVSLVAANVAEISSAEATQNLIAIMQAYKLEVGDLAGVLATMNEASNNFNVANKDILSGLQKTAAVTRQAGLGLGELIGLIGTGVGTTGQSGANIGNAIKALTVSLASPDIQETLRNSFGVEVLADATGRLKPLGEVLDELKGSYDRLNDAARGDFIKTIAGKFQASRIVALFDNYNTAAALSANSLLDLNSAEEENARVTATLKNSLAGLGAVGGQLVFAVLGDSAREFGKTLDGVRVIAANLVPVLGRIGSGRFKLLSTLPGVGLLSTGLQFAGERLTDPVDKAGNRASDLAKQAEGYEIAARAFRRNAQETRAGRPLDRRGLSGFGGAYLPDDLPADPVEAVRMLEERAAVLEATRDEIRAAESAERQKIITELEGRLQAETELRSKLKAAGKTAEADARTRNISRLNQQIGLAQDRTRAIAVDYDAEGNAVVIPKTSRQRAEFAARTLATLKSAISGFTTTPLGRLNAELALMEQTLARLPAGEVAFNELRNSLTQGIAALQLDRPVAALASQMQLRERFARAQFDGFLTGDSEGERLRNQRKKLEELGNVPGRSPYDEQLRLNALLENSLRLRERALAVERDMDDLRRNARREEARALVSAGPDEILKRLAAQRFAGTRDVGEFFSLGAGVRDLIGRNPDSPFSVEGGALRREQRLLQESGFAGLPVETFVALEAAGGRAARGLVAVAEAAEKLLAGIPGAGAPPGPPALPTGRQR